MGIQFRCPGCGKLLSARDDQAGKKARCPACKQIVAVLRPGETAPAAAGGVAHEERQLAPIREIVCKCGRILRVAPPQLERGVTCMNCGRRVPSDEEPEEAKPRESPELPRGVVASLRDAFTYPFRGQGPLAAGAVVLAQFAASLIAPCMCIFGIIPLVLAYGYRASYMLSALAASAREEHDPPGLPEYRDILGSILHPFMLFFVPFLLAYLPAGLYEVLAVAGTLPAHGFSIGAQYYQLEFLGLMALGTLVFPMMLMRVAGLYSLQGLNPAVVMRSIVRVPGPYLGLVFILFIALLIETFGKGVVGLVPVVGPYIAMAVAPLLSVYIMLVDMRLMGMFVAKHWERLGWTDLAPLPKER